jgi:hypothetical protein
LPLAQLFLQVFDPLRVVASHLLHGLLAAFAIRGRFANRVTSGITGAVGGSGWRSRRHDHSGRFPPRFVGPRIDRPRIWPRRLGTRRRSELGSDGPPLAVQFRLRQLDPGSGFSPFGQSWKRWLDHFRLASVRRASVWLAKIRLT